VPAVPSSSTPTSANQPRRGAATNSPGGTQRWRLCGDERIGILASGGLKHFWWTRIRRAILKPAPTRSRVLRTSRATSSCRLVGNPELVALAGAAEHLDLDWFEYVRAIDAAGPEGLSFATWV